MKYTLDTSFLKENPNEINKQLKFLDEAITKHEFFIHISTMLVMISGILTAMFLLENHAVKVFLTLIYVFFSVTMISHTDEKKERLIYQKQLLTTYMNLPNQVITIETDIVLEEEQKEN